VIELGEVQGNVLHAYGTDFPFARYVHLEVKGDARGVLARWLPHVSFGRRPQWLAREEALRPHVNLAFTYGGLEALRVQPDMLHAFPEDFRQGARARSRDVDGDKYAAERDWEQRPGDGHVLLIVHAHEKEQCGECVDALLAESDDALVPIAQQETALIKRPGGEDKSCGTLYSREPFGFADGCSQPSVAHVDDDPTGDGLYARVPPRSWLRQFAMDLGLMRERREWRPIRAGEFLLGYVSEDGRLPEGPPAPLGPNGTFMVYRKIEQHVKAFDDHMDAEADRLGMKREELRARVLGRWPDGTPLSLSPDKPDPAIAINRHRANDFDYADDLDGGKCPLGAHVRRTNPRNGLPGGAETTMRHRIIRRGMPYHDGDQRGLLFIAFSASIKEGFETIQRLWCNDGAALGLGDEPDYLLQQPRDGKLSGMFVNHDPANPQRIEAPPKPFVTVRGCEYLFLPSRRACAWLSGR
jgi:Dyp-type peroxidase family